MECRHIRVLLDLSKLKEKKHKYVWMLVSTSDLKSIADFKDAVIKKLALDSNEKIIKMFINGGLLLEEENILVLRENDSVQIQYENLSTTDLHITSCMQKADRLISDANLSSELCSDNLSKTVKSSTKKKRFSEVVVDDALNGNKEEYLHKRISDPVSNGSSENHNGINLPQEESAVTFCNINEESTCNKKRKRKKSCRASTPIVTEQYNNKTPEKSVMVFLDTNEESIYDSKKRNLTQYSCISMVENAPIQIEGSNGKKIIDAKSVFEVSDSNVSVHKEKKRKSCSNSTSSDAYNHNQQFGVDEEISIIPEEISYDDSSREINKMEISETNINNTTVESFVQSNNCKKKKRQRHRKRKIEQNLVSPFLTENISTSCQPMKDQPNFNSSDNFSGIRKHIRFTSPEPDSKMKEEDIVDLEPPNQECVSEINFEASQNNSCISTNTMSFSSQPEADTNYATDVGSSKTYAASSHTSLISNSYISPTRNNYLNELSLKNPVSKSKKHEPERNLVVHSFEDYPLLNTLPCIGTCIAFKLLELNASYSPEVSSYKEGKIKSINPNTEEIEIELTKEEIKPGRIGKFENLKEGEDPVIEVTKKVTTCWSSLIEPRLVSLK